MSSLAGLGGLVRLALRRDRVRLLAWIGVLALVAVGTAAAFADLYPDETSRLRLVATVASNPAMVALLGPVHDAAIGALTAWRVGSMLALLAGLMSVLTMARHTREDEETGRRELLGSTVVGRHAPLAAALVTMCLAAAGLALLLVAGLVGLGLPVGGGLSFGLGAAGVAVLFAGVGAVAAQITESSSAAKGIGVGVAGLAFVLRMVGDGGEASGLGWLSWTSPIGWFGKLRPFAGEQWWILGLWPLAGALLAALAFALAARRDVGAGLVRPRPGPDQGAPGLSSPFALAWRMHRGSVAGWSAGLTVIGVVYGSVGDTIGDLLDTNPEMARIFELIGGEAAITDAFFSAAVGVLALVASAYAVRSVLRMRTEEESGRAEPVLATSVSRARWALSHLTVAAAGPAVMLVAAGVAAGLTHGAIVGDVGGRVGAVLTAAVLHIPAVLVLTGLAMALFGLAPARAALSWAALVVFLLLGQLGQILQFPAWSLNLSPFSHVPTYPVEAIDPVALVAVAGVALGLAGAGVAGLRRRDLLPG